MPGIIPDQSAGAVNANNDLAMNVYIPDPIFTMSCTYRALPSNCDARVLPSQINAIVSEMIALAECFDPEGTWNCTSLTNLCQNFSTYKDNVQAILDNHEARISTLEGGGISGIKTAYSAGILHMQVFTATGNTNISDWDTVQIPNGGLSYNSALGAFTVLEEGQYMITAYINLEQSGSLARLSAVVNGNVIAAQGDRGDTNQQRLVSLAVLFNCNVNDTIVFKLLYLIAGPGSTTKLSEGTVCISKVGSIVA